MKFWTGFNSYSRLRLSLTLFAGLCCFFAVGNLRAQFAGSARLRTLVGHVPAGAQGLTPIGVLPPAQRLNLAISLPLRNAEALDQLLGELYDPASPNYRKYVTPQQFSERFGASEADYATLAQFVQSNQFTVTATHPNRLVLDVNGSVADIERVFHVTLRVYNHPTEARTFFAPDSEPSIDSALPILRISGLDNYSLPHPNFKFRPSDQASNAEPRTGSGPSGYYQGADFRNAYVPGTLLTGAGQNVGLLQFDGYYSSDIATYENQIGIILGPQLITVPVDGGVSTPGSGNTEVSLDIEMVISMAPGVSKIYVYEAPNPSPWVDLLSKMANDNLAKQLSCSWGGGSPDPASETIFKQMASQGQSFFNASGDSDAFTSAIPFPADSTNIVQVGGTTLTTGTGATYSSETVWNWGSGSGSSGGISTYYPIPSWQRSVSMASNKGSTTMRNVPDVALTADKVYVRYGNGSAGGVGGTSCAAPLWAGFTALANQRAASAGLPPVGFLNPALYAIGTGTNYASCFHDVTAGNNTWSRSRTKFYATSGFDLCTGWGTPNGTSLINALVAVTNVSHILPVPPVLLAPATANNTGFQFTIFGSPGFNYIIESATNLSNWSVVTTLTNLTGTVLFSDTNFHNFSSRFYRARVIP